MAPQNPPPLHTIQPGTAFRPDGTDPGPHGLAAGSTLLHHDRDPHAEYSSRLAARQADLALWIRRDDALVRARLVVAGVFLLLALAAAGIQGLTAVWVVAPGSAFLALLIAHDRVRGRRERAARMVGFYARGLARLEDRWAEHGDAGDRFLDAAHPYARDLDLFGHGSLFQLLNQARTQSGEATLARWLTAPAAPDEVLARQAAVRELTDRLDLREDLAVLGEDVRAGVDPEKLAEWGKGRDLPATRGVRSLAALLALLDVAAVLIWWPLGYGWQPLAVAASLAFLFSWRYRAGATRILGGAEELRPDLEILAPLLERLEREPFTSPKLVALQQTFLGRASGTEPASLAIARLARRVDLQAARTSIMFAPFAALLLWGTQFAFAIEAWRTDHGRDLERWLEAVGELEALSSLAAYAYERPADTYPTFEDGVEAVQVDGGGRPGDEPTPADRDPEAVRVAPGLAFLDAKGIGHPLLPRSRCVTNDLRLDSATRFLLVSGSNMSGKSTLLRSVGINVALAQAGGPVRAVALTLSPLVVGAAIRVQDSLQDGISHFYAEILRLRQIVRLSESGQPVLFLADEILEGTNSHDRGVGTEAIVRGLLERGAIGLITTHDLALTRLPETLGPAVVNIHLQDQLIDGRMTFDYRIRPGVVGHSNAVALMQSIGLIP